MNKRQIKKARRKLKDAERIYFEALRLEAERIEAELPCESFINNLDPPKHLYDKIVQELKDKGIWREE